jgi:hypothetical protein
MSEIGTQPGAHAGVVSESSDSRIHMLAVYSAFTLIAAIVFGTLSYRPF